ncbi:hypothetical protein PENCOP_c011G02750 [Penicillium coprophilum]|uniref:Nucleoside phosphorylase domain-containing protein n=1 Tax=Penicillium coprophilum TaxID=36646 RepID=A0A1V6UEU2_9EURO|nr:hypothetical protein PENCOP_c011G02750 [Penicillium coprophilum]
MEQPRELPRRQDFRVGWIAALYKEYLAARQVLDEQYDDFEVSRHKGDLNHYTFGRVGKHYVVIASLPTGVPGTHSASSVANGMINTFPLIRFALMVGIAGGAPTKDNDVRLGDIVIGTRMIPYSFIRQHPDKRENIGDNVVSSRDLLSTIHRVQANITEGAVNLESTISSRFNKTEEIIDIFQRPEPESDRLYQSDYLHAALCDCLSVSPGNSNTLVQRQQRKSYAKVKVHCGSIGSADIVLRDANERDRLSDEFKILCFEMESAGICLDNLPILPIRGICDYADSHKNKEWQGYAAAVAAVYARCLLQTVSSGDLLKGTKPVDADDLRKEIEILVTAVEKMSSIDIEEQLRGHESKLEKHDKIFRDAHQAMDQIHAMIEMTRGVATKSAQANSEAINDLESKTIDNARAIESAHRKIEKGQQQLQKILEAMQEHIKRQQETSPPEQRPKWDDLQAEAQKESTSLQDATEKTEKALKNATRVLDDFNRATGVTKFHKIRDATERTGHFFSFTNGIQKLVPTGRANSKRGTKKRKYHGLTFGISGPASKTHGCPKPTTHKVVPSPIGLRGKNRENLQINSSFESSSFPEASSSPPPDRGPVRPPLPPRNQTVSLSEARSKLPHGDSTVMTGIKKIDSVSPGVAKLPPRPAQEAQGEVSAAPLNQRLGIHDQIEKELAKKLAGKKRPSLPLRPQPIGNTQSCSPCQSAEGSPGLSSDLVSALYHSTTNPVGGSQPKTPPVPHAKPKHLASFNPNMRQAAV